MDYINVKHRRACREIGLPAFEKKMFMRLLREISVNAVRTEKSWLVKEHFVELWSISASSFPALAKYPHNECIVEWIVLQLSMPLMENEKDKLWIYS